MKKTLVALAVAAVAATSANAAVVYNQDGTKVEVGGSVRLILTKVKEDDKSKRLDLANKGSRLEVRASHDLGEGLKALAYGRLNLGDETFNGVTLNKLYAGFSLDDVGALTFGRQATNADDLHLSDYTYNLTGINKTLGSGDKVARFTSAEFHGFKLGLDYVFGTSDKEKLNDRGYAVSAFYDRTLGDVGFKFNAGYSHKKSTDVEHPAVKEIKDKAFIVATELSYAQFSAALDYSQSKVTHDSEGFSKEKAIELGLKYQVTEKSDVYAVFQWEKNKNLKNNTTDKTRGYFLGADYKVHPQVVTYVEGGVSKTKHDDGSKTKDNAVNLGLRVFF